MPDQFFRQRELSVATAFTSCPPLLTSTAITATQSAGRIHARRKINSNEARSRLAPREDC